MDGEATQGKCSFELAFTSYKVQKNGYSIILKQILNIAKIKDSDCNSLTVEVGSNVADDKVKKI